MNLRISLIARQLFVICAVAALSGCALKPTDSFELLVDLPAQFSFRSDARYRPATGETCTLGWRSGALPENKVFQAAGASKANRARFEVPLTERVDGCPLVLRTITFDVYTGGAANSAQEEGDFTFMGVRDLLEPNSALPIANNQELPGRCQWLFQPLEASQPMLKCNFVNTKGSARKFTMGGAVQRDELKGKTVWVVMALPGEQ